MVAIGSSNIWSVEIVISWSVYPQKQAVVLLWCLTIGFKDKAIQNGHNWNQIVNGKILLQYPFTCELRLSNFTKVDNFSETN